MTATSASAPARRNDCPYYVHPVTGERLTRVTTVLDSTRALQHVLVPWSARVAAEYAVTNLAALRALLRKKNGHEAAVRLVTEQAEALRGVKRDAGVYVHDVVEALALWGAKGAGAEFVLPVLPAHLAEAGYDGDPLPLVVDAMVTGFLNFVTDFGASIEAAEMTVYNQPMGVAGTLDLIVRLTGVRIGRRGRKVCLVPAPGNTLTLCVDVKTGRVVDVTWKEQLAAYRRMPECEIPTVGVMPMPATDAGAVLHLRPEHRRGYRLMIVHAREDAEAWNRFRDAARLYFGRGKANSKPGTVCYPPAADGTVPPPDLDDLDGEGYGHAPGVLRNAGLAHLGDVAARTAAELLALKGVGGKTLDTIRRMLADHGLHLAGENENENEGEDDAAA